MIFKIYIFVIGYVTRYITGYAIRYMIKYMTKNVIECSWGIQIIKKLGVEYDGRVIRDWWQQS